MSVCRVQLLSCNRRSLSGVRCMRPWVRLLESCFLLLLIARFALCLRCQHPACLPDVANPMSNMSFLATAPHHHPATWGCQATGEVKTVLTLLCVCPAVAAFCPLFSVPCRCCAGHPYVTFGIATSRPSSTATSLTTGSAAVTGSQAALLPTGPSQALQQEAPD